VRILSSLYMTVGTDTVLAGQKYHVLQASDAYQLL
jgi:hypothetical protein